MAIKEMRRVIALTVALTALQGCSDKEPREPYVFMLADFLTVKELPYDSPPQVIYRIDDHRFVTLERYRDCYHGEAYYNDTRAGLRASLGRASIEDFQGRLINADPSGRNLAFPSGGPPHMVAGDRGLSVELLYSTDGGRTFNSMDYLKHSFDPFEESKGYTIAVTKDKLFIAKEFQYRTDRDDYDLSVDQYPLDPTVDLSKPYPPGFHGDSAWASKQKIMPDNLRTPSGQDRITCDTSIKPTNPDAPLVTNRD